MRAVYLPEFQSVGPVINANLFSPEATLMTTPNIIGFLNGMSSLIRFGLTDCDSGFGTDRNDYDFVIGKTVPGKRGYRRCGQPAYPSLGWLGGLDKSSSEGVLSYAPEPGTSPSQIIAELDVLLTAGRLDPSTREVIEREYVRARDVPTYRNATSQTCEAWGGRNITSRAECLVAARELGVSLNASLQEVEDDGMSANGWKPTGCYYNKRAAGGVVFNVAASNRGACKTNNNAVCFCSVGGNEAAALARAMTLLMASAEFHVTNSPQLTKLDRQVATRPTSQGRRCAPPRRILIPSVPATQQLAPGCPAAHTAHARGAAHALDAAQRTHCRDVTFSFAGSKRSSTSCYKAGSIRGTLSFHTRGAEMRM